MKRIGWIDTAKGILIILVIAGHVHVNLILDILINSFHMGAFFFLSGVTFHTNGNFKGFLRKKIQGIICPYLIFAIIMLTYDFLKAIIFSKNNFSFWSGLVSIFIPISGRNQTTTYGLWFFSCLFLTPILVYFHIKIYKKAKTAGAIFIFIVYALSILCYKMTGIASIISILPFSMSFFLLGYYLKDNLMVVKKREYFVWRR